MKNIISRSFQLLKDPPDLWQFMLEIHERDCRNGVSAPFLEYALCSTWMDTSYSFLDRVWQDGEKIIGFVFYESSLSEFYFNLRPGYEEIAEEMVRYAVEDIPDFGEEKQLILFGGQTALKEAARKLNFYQAETDLEWQFDFRNELNYELPPGFHFVEGKDSDLKKLVQCCWKGFGHEEKVGPWQDGGILAQGTTWTPGNQLKSAYLGLTAPHGTPDLDVVIANNATGEYVCFSGMCWVPENKLAYMEPLCTVPAYRHRGLSAAALTKHYRQMKALGATHMTGGMNDFYPAIGYEPGVEWGQWRRKP